MIFRFGPFSLDSERYELTRGGVPLAVEPRPLEVLVELVRHRHRVVRKEELVERLWDGRFVSDSALTRAVREVRRALGDRGGTDGWIQTVYGRGYRFTGEVVEEPPGGEPLAAPAGDESTGDVVVATAGSEPATPAALPSSAAPPLPLTPLIGRAREVEEVRRLLRGSRLLTLTGASGTGKTRVALEVARAAARDFPGGVAWVALAELRDPGAVLAKVARALGVRDRPGRDPVAGLAEHVGERRLLLVLDNFEQVLAGAPRLAELARRTPRLVVLVTSRFVLGVEGEQEVPLGGLAVPAEGERDPRAIAASPAVTLFLDRARAARPGLPLADDDLATIGGLVRRLDGLPLALELAAARVKLMTPAEILDRLGRRLDLGAQGASDRPPRHRTLRQALGWSLDLLDEEERRCLFRLSVFSGGFTLDAAAAVACDPERALPLLTALVDKSLVERLGSGPGGSRFAMLETTRQIAAERLAALEDDEAAARRAHAAWALALAERAEPALAGGADQAEWLARIDAEHGNLLAAFDFAVASGEVEDGLATAAAMWRWWSARGAYREGYERLLSLLDHPAAAAAAATPARVRALGALGALACLLWDLDTARRRLGEGLDLARRLGDGRAEADLLAHLGWVHIEGGDLDGGGELSRRALALHRRWGDLRGEAAALNNLAWEAIYRDDTPRAERCLRESLALRRRAGDGRGEVMALATLAWIDRSKERLDERRELVCEARRLAERLDDGPLAAYTRSAAGLVAFDGGDVPSARRALDEGVAFFRGVGHDFAIAWFLSHLAEIEIAEGHRDEARRRLDEADRVWARMGNAWGAELTAKLRRSLAARQKA